MFDPTFFTPVFYARFIAKVDKTDTCWLWTAAMTPLGYGRFRAGRLLQAHRWSYEYHVGPIPDGLVLDHLCRTPRCVNPDHLEPVTHRENILRGETVAAHRAAQTHCKRNHEFTPENTYIQMRRGFPSRHCCECARWHERKRAKRTRKRIKKQSA